MLRHFQPWATIVVVAVAVASAGAQQSGVSLSPSVTFPVRGNAGPMAGLTLGVTDGPVSVRAGGQFSMRERTGTPAGATTPFATRPWSVDADALLFFARNDWYVPLRLSPYIFAGVGTALIDSAAGPGSRRSPKR